MRSGPALLVLMGDERIILVDLARLRPVPAGVLFFIIILRQQFGVEGPAVQHDPPIRWISGVS